MALWFEVKCRRNAQHNRSSRDGKMAWCLVVRGEEEALPGLTRGLGDGVDDERVQHGVRVVRLLAALQQQAVAAP